MSGFIVNICFEDEQKFRKIVNEHPHTVEALKDIIKEKDFQIKDLSSKFRSLLLGMS
jgi:hypothetical protein